MTKSETKILETEVVIFPMKFGQQSEEKIFIENGESDSESEKKIVENNAENKFARLKKSLRKKSASIL